MLYIKKKLNSLAFRQKMEESTIAYDKVLAKRIEKLMKKKERFSKKGMFGDIDYMIIGNMCFGVHKEYLDTALGKKYGAICVTGKTYKAI